MSELCGFKMPCAGCRWLERGRISGYLECAWPFPKVSNPFRWYAQNRSAIRMIPKSQVHGPWTDDAVVCECEVREEALVRM